MQLFSRLPLDIMQMIAECLQSKEMGAFARTNYKDIFTQLKNRLNRACVKYWLYYVSPKQKEKQQAQVQEVDSQHVRVYLVDVNPCGGHFKLAHHTVARSRIEAIYDDEWSAGPNATFEWTFTERLWRIGRDTQIELAYLRIRDGPPDFHDHFQSDSIVMRRLFNFKCLPTSLQHLILPDWFHATRGATNYSNPLPSIVPLTKLHTLEFIYPSSIRISQLVASFDEWEWPQSLRTLRIAARDFDARSSVYWLSEGSGAVIESLHFPDTLTEIDIGSGESLVSNSLISHPAPEMLHLPAELLSLRFNRLPADFLTEPNRLPQSLTHLTIPDHFDRIITALPRDLIRLQFGRDFNQDLLNILVWPTHLTHISFGFFFRQSITDVKFPPTLEYLEFTAKDFSVRARKVTLLPNLSHTQLHTLILSQTEFLHPDPTALPATLRTLRFGRQLDHRLKAYSGASHLPSNLTELNFGDEFNCMHEFTRWSLPKNLRRLYFGFQFDQPIEPHFSFPSTLELLSFDLIATPKDAYGSPSPRNGTRGCMSHPMPESLARTQLRFLSLPQAWNQPLNTLHLPSTLRELVWSVRQPTLVEAFHLPPQLERLLFKGPFAHSMNNIVLPSSLRYLECDTKESLMNEPFPSSLRDTQLESLTMSQEWNEDPRLLLLPPTLTHLQFCEGFRQSLAGLDLSATTSLCRLILPSTYSAPLPHLDATRITILQLPRDFHDASFANIRLPATLHTLEFGSRFNQPIRGLILPPGLKKLQFGLDFDQSLTDLILPSPLQIFAIGPPSNEWTKFRQIDSLASMKFPSSLRTLVVPDPCTYLVKDNRIPTSSITAYAQTLEEWRRSVSRVSTLKYHLHDDDLAYQARLQLQQLRSGHQVRGEGDEQ